MNDLHSKNDQYLKQPIIIFGTGRSGTTVISDIIFHHEDLAWHSNWQELLPKSAAINYLRRAFDNGMWHIVGMNTQNNKSIINQLLFRPIERYDFWESITGPRIDFSRGFLLNERVTEEEKNKMRDHFAKMVKYQKRKRLAFKLTGPARMEYLLSIFPDAQFVQILRDPVSTVRSWMEIHWSNQMTEQLWWDGAYTEEEKEHAEQLKNDPPLFVAFQYKKLVETTAYEIEKTKADVYNARYEDFVKDPKQFISNMMDHLHLPQSKYVDAFMNKIAVKDRNNRAAASARTSLSDDTKKKILDIVNGTYTY